MINENKRQLWRVYIIALSTFISGVIVGAVYYAYKYYNSPSISSYSKNYIATLKSGMSFSEVSITAAKSYLYITVAIAVAAFFKVGIFISLAIFAKKGFVSAFTTAAMINSFGVKGLAMVVPMLPQMLIAVPTIAFTISLCRIYHHERNEIDNRSKIIYIIFLLLCCTIFCTSAITEGFLTTTFMKWLAFKVT